MFDPASGSRKLAVMATIGLALGLGGCASNCAAPPAIVAEPAPVESCPPPEAVSYRMPEIERRQRLCLDDKRRLEQALQESQKRAGELQRKLDALLAIDRELRSREKGAR